MPFLEMQEEMFRNSDQNSDIFADEMMNQMLREVFLGFDRRMMYRRRRATPQTVIDNLKILSQEEI